MLRSVLNQPNQLMKDKDDAGKFHALPYEITHPLVKLATLHLTEYMKARKEFKDLEGEDPQCKGVKTKEAKKLMKNMSKADRFAILNRRTGWAATPEWLSKHIMVKDGKPVLKNSSSKIHLWVLTVRIEINGDIAKLMMSPSSGKPFREVRCMSLEDGHVKSEFAQLVKGYAHVLEDEDALKHRTHKPH